MRPEVFAIALTLVGQVDGSENPRPEDVYCGSYSLFVALKSLGIGPESFEGLQQRLGTPGPDGYSLLQLDQAARSFGAKTIAAQTSLENLAWRPERFACITVINDHHYVLLYKIEDGKVFVCDTPQLYNLPSESFESNWSRKALLIGVEDFLPEEAIIARRARNHWVRATVTVTAIVILAFGVWRVGHSVVRRRSSAASAVLFVGMTIGAGCAGEPKSMPVAIPESSKVSEPYLLSVAEIGKVFGSV